MIRYGYAAVALMIVTSAVSAQGNANSNALPGGDPFVTLPSSDKLGSKVVGTYVYNNRDEKIGYISDIAFDQSVNGYIIHVGGLLGIGGHYVVVRPSAIKMIFDGSSKRWNATIDSTADQLKTAPEYNYPNDQSG